MSYGSVRISLILYVQWKLYLCKQSVKNVAALTNMLISLMVEEKKLMKMLKLETSLNEKHSKTGGSQCF